MRATSNPVVCFGEVLLRLSPPDRHLLVQAQGFDLAVGGAEANVGSALAALGHVVRFAGVVSDNPLGDRALAALRGCGIDPHFIARRPGRMGLYFLESGSGPRPSAITYDRAGSAFASAAPAAIDFAGALAGARLLHCGGITPALGPKGVMLARAAQSAAKAAGVPICFDGNYRAQLWDAWDSDPAVTTVVSACTSRLATLYGARIGITEATPGRVARPLCEASRSSPTTATTVRSVPTITCGRRPSDSTRATT